MTANPMPPMIPMSGPTGAMLPQGAGRFKAVDPLRVIRAHLWWLVASAPVGVMLGVAVWFALNYTMPKFTSRLQLRVNPVLFDVGRIGGANRNETQAIELEVMNQISRLRSEDLLRKTLERPDVRATNWFQQFQGNVGDALEDLQTNVLGVSPIRDTSLINVGATTHNKSDPRVIINGLVSVYMLQMDQETGSLTGDKRTAYVVERRRLESQIAGLNNRLSRFTTENRITSFDSRMADSQRLAELYTKQLAELQLQLEGTREMHRMLSERQQSGDTEPSADDVAQVSQMPQVADIQRRIDSYKENLTTMVSALGENHYQAGRLRERIAAAEQELESKRKEKLREMQAGRLVSYANSVNSLQVQVTATLEKLAQEKAQLTDLTQKLAEHNQIQTELRDANQSMAKVEEMLGNLRIFEVHPESRPVKRYSSATEPEKTFPQPAVIVPAVTLLVVGLTTGLIFLFEMLDQRVKAPADVKMLQDAELLGTLPDAGEDPSGPTGIERVVEKYPTGLMAESFREVRTAIMNKMDRRGYKTLMIVAAQPRSGTSSITQNLATSLAFHGRHVAIIDANFRRPAQHRLFDVANEIGLVEVLKGNASIADAIHKVNGVSISVLTTGHASDAPPELLEGGAFRSVIGELESNYDIVLIDAPPALLASDSQLLAKHVDAVVAIVRAIADKRGMVERMHHRLTGQRADLLGLVLNGVQSAAGGYFRKSYREFYRYRENGSSKKGDGHAVRDRGGVADETPSR